MSRIYLFLNPSVYSSKFFNTYRAYLHQCGHKTVSISNILSVATLAIKLQSSQKVIPSAFIFCSHYLYLSRLSAFWLLRGQLASPNPIKQYELDYYSLLDDELITLYSHLTAERTSLNRLQLLRLTLFLIFRCIVYLSFVRVLASSSVHFVCCTNERTGIKNSLITTLQYYSRLDVSVVEFNLGNCQLNRPRSTLFSHPRPHRPEMLPAFSVEPLSDSYTYKNVVYLHVFGDSSCHVFTPYRLYRNYYQWLVSIINRIKLSDQKWIVRIHPHSLSWGEDSFSFIKNFFPGLLDLHNIVIDFAEQPIGIIKGDRVVTFNGTIADELAAIGIRALTYELTTSEQLCPGSTVLLSTYSLESYYLSDDVDRRLLTLDKNISDQLLQFSNSLEHPSPSSLSTSIVGSKACYVNNEDFTVNELISYYPFLLSV